MGLVFAIVAFWSVFKTAQFPQAYGLDLTPENILNGINKERTLKNLPLLYTDPRLSSAAQNKSMDMVKRKYFSHTDPEGNYIWPKIVEAGYTPYITLGENLAIEFYSTESLVAAWMNSPTHRANVLNENFQDQGMGLAFGSAQNGEYSSAITNTFGTLQNKNTLTAKPAQPVAGQSTPPVSETAKTPEQTLTAEEKIKNEAGTKDPLPKKTEPAQPRGEQQKIVVTTSSTDSEPPAVKVSQNKPLANTSIVVKESDSPYKKNQKTNIAMSSILLGILLADAEYLRRQKGAGLDKKINHMVLLGFAILFTAFLYWF